MDEVARYLVLCHAPDPTTTWSGDLSSSCPFIIPINVGEELVWDLVDVVGKAVECPTGQLLRITSVICKVHDGRIGGLPSLYSFTEGQCRGQRAEKHTGTHLEGKNLEADGTGRDVRQKGLLC